MNILCISEHFIPMMGGTTTYVVQTCMALRKEGHSVTLVYPSKAPYAALVHGSHENFSTIEIGLGIDIRSGFTRQLRYQFCELAADLADQLIAEKKVEVIHVLAGLFLVEKLPVKKWQDQQIGVMTTVHNLPPQECGVSWKGDRFLNYQLDKLRRIGVGMKNRARIRAHPYHALIVPSEAVKILMAEVVPKQHILVTGHGHRPLDNPISIRDFQAEQKLNILTVGGLIPHKNQHSIIPIAHLLNEAKVPFHWTIIGPARLPQYKEYIQEQIRQNNLEEQISLRISVPTEELIQAYSSANLYVQLSKEEGFCMTTLDAALFGLPIVGTLAGAIPEIIERSTGILSNNTPKDIFEAICTIHQNRSAYQPSEANRKALMAHFNWQHAAKQLTELYHSYV